jgi:hypothetical protein
MAKVAKNQTKIKGAEKDYLCSWTYATPLESWSSETLVHNIRYGIVPAIKKLIQNSVLGDEANIVKNKQWLDLTNQVSEGTPEQMAIINNFCKLNNIKTTIQTEFVIHEADCMAIVEEEEE